MPTKSPPGARQKKVKPRKPAAKKAPSPKITARRKRAAAATVAGKAASKIAQAEGVSRVTISKDLRSAEARLEVAKLLDSYAPYIELLMERALLAIDSALEAKRTVVLSCGGGVTEAKTLAEPDYLIRLAGIKRLAELVRLGRAAPTQNNEQPAVAGWKYEHFRSLVKKHEVAQ